MRETSNVWERPGLRVCICASPTGVYPVFALRLLTILVCSCVGVFSWMHKHAVLYALAGAASLKHEGPRLVRKHSDQRRWYTFCWFVLTGRRLAPSPPFSLPLVSPAAARQVMHKSMDPCVDYTI